MTDAVDWPPAGPASGSDAGGITTVTTWLRVIRPDDLLSLTFGLVNLTVQDGQLVRVTPGSPATIIVGLPPQHIAEAAVPVGSGEVPPPIAAAVAGGSQLAFTVPAGVNSLPLNLPTLLGWSAFAPVPPAQPAGTAARPAPAGSILELPYRMLLAVDGAEWQHPTAAVLDPVTGTAELWRTTAAAPALHVTWSQNLDPVPPPPKNSLPRIFPDFQDALGGVRNDIATQAPALEADSLTLSALGATTSLRALLPQPIPGAPDVPPVTDWHHITSLGRDSYVRTVQRGFLAPFGHPAAIITVAERIPAGSVSAPVEEVVSTSRLIILSSQVDYTTPAAATAYSGPNQAMSVPLRKVQLPDLAGTIDVGPELATKGGMVGTDQVPYAFRAVAEDLSGAAVELSLPMAFVPAEVLAVTSDVATMYRNFSLDAAKLRGQAVAFVGVPGAVAAAVDQYDNTVLSVESMAFDLFPAAGSGLPFLPKLNNAAVQVASAGAVAGAAAQLLNIQYHPDYLTRGIDSAVNPGTVFAQLTGASSPLQLAASAAGGLAAPQLPIDGLSQALGPVAGAADLINGAFNPTTLLKQFDQSVFLGGIKLSDLLAPLAGATFDAAKVPAFVRSQLPHAIQTTFTWTPDLQGPTVIPPPPPSSSAPAPGDPPMLSMDTSQAKLSLSVTVTAPLDPAQQPTSVVHGVLTSTYFVFLEAVKLYVDQLEFTATTGRKVDLKTGPKMKIEFIGDLAFLNELASALPGGLGNGPYVDADADGVTVGYSLAVPSVSIGIVSIQNIAFDAALSLPLAVPPQPLRLQLDFATREHPFLVSISFIGGGGYFCADVGSDRVHQIEASIDIGANLSVDLAIVSAEVHVLAGFYFGMTETNTTFFAFLRIGGSVDLLGLISVSVELYLALGYSSDHSDIFGRASLTLAIHVLFINKSVTLSTEKHFPVPGSGPSENAVSARAASALATAGPADPPGPDTPSPTSFGDLLTPADWDLYLGAFA
jgi:hypothetical protein